MPGSLQITPHEAVEVREETPEALEVEGTWAPGAPLPRSTSIPSRTSGSRSSPEPSGRAWRAWSTRCGDVLEVPRAAVHQVWNATAEPARARWRTLPAGRTRSWFETLDGLQRSGRTGRNGMPGPLAFGVCLTEYRDVFRLAGPQPVLLGALRLLGALGRLRGYRVRS